MSLCPPRPPHPYGCSSQAFCMLSPSLTFSGLPHLQLTILSTLSFPQVSLLFKQALPLPSLPFWLGPHFSFPVHKETSIHASSGFLPPFSTSANSQLLPSRLLLWNCMLGSVANSMLSNPVVISLHLCRGASAQHLVKLTFLPFETLHSWALWSHISSTCKCQSTSSLQFLPGRSSLLPELYCLNANGFQMYISCSDISPELHTHLHIWLWDISTWIPHKHVRFIKTKVKFLIFFPSSSFWPISVLSKWYYGLHNLLSQHLKSIPYSSYYATTN